ncbi:recombinase family protein [uncultured Pseudophaeobacter sp.]|uniref:recombinase family protein n=1 Tax=uncultured Pseudophaeobacter sp. TaxID=1759421 RepID=UPI0025E0F7CF|nr:recombinase family protein [uncultured Pseudophaeobacter sp.]
MTDKPRVAIYARYSSDMQNPKSVDDQFSECRKHAERSGYEVVKEYADAGLSGALRDRPGFQELLAAIHARSFDIVLFEHVDRLGRDLERASNFYKAATFADIELHQLGKGKLGLLDIGIMSTMAQIFLEDLALKTRRGLRGKFERGQSAGGRSYGYALSIGPDGIAKKGQLTIDDNEAAIIRRIFTDYASGASPIKIAAQLNADGIPSPAANTKRITSGHWKQNTINGNPTRGTGILNNELYIGRRIWNRLRYSKHPETGKRVSRLNPVEDWEIQEVPDLRIIDQELWDAVKAVQAGHRKVRSTTPATDKKGLSVGQSFRRRKYLLSGLMTCGQCGGNLTVAGSGKARRYYCANAKEKGASVCSGMRGLKEQDAATSILSGLKSGLMQDEAYTEFRENFLARKKAEAEENGQMLKLHDKTIHDLKTKIANIVQAVEDGDAPTSLKARLKELEADLKAAEANREAIKPTPVTLPEDLPVFYRAHIDDLVGTLSDEDVSGRASDELHQWVNTVVVTWDADAKHHALELRGKLLEMLNVTKPAGGAGLDISESSLSWLRE